MKKLSEDIVKEWGLGTLPEAKQTEMVNRIGKMLYQAVLTRSLDILSEKEQLELDLLLNEDTSTPETVLAFLQSKISTFDQILSEERENLRRDVLAPTT